MHLFIPSNACVERFPDNNSAHFKIHLPEILHLPNHEICLERVYYSKELSSVNAVPIDITIKNTETFSDLITFHFASPVTSRDDFGAQFIQNIEYTGEVNKANVYFERHKHIVALVNRTSHSIRVQIPSDLIKAYNSVKIFGFQ